MQTSELILATPELPLDHRMVQVGERKDGDPIIILLHGMGSNEGGMLKLADIGPPGSTIYSLRAPDTMSPGKYSWYHAILTEGTPSIRFDEAERSRHLILRFIKSVRDQKGGSGAKVIVGGFSQGGVMSYNIGLTAPELVSGIFILGSRLQSEIRTHIRPSTELKHLKVFVGHGTDDRMLLLSHAHEAVAYLRHIGLHPSLHEYPIGHTISPEMMSDLGLWFANI